MQTSRFDLLNRFIKKRKRLILVVWFAILIVSLAFLPSFFSHVSYDITGGIGGPSNTESQRAQTIINKAFPSSGNQTESNAIIVLVQGANPYSDSMKNAVLSLNKTLASDSKIGNYTGMQNVYSTEFGLLNSSLPSLLPEVGTLEANISSINSNLYSLVQNLANLSSATFQLEQGVNQTAQLVYGVPSSFVGAWSGVLSSPLCNGNATCANNQANQIVAPNLSGEAAAYYGLFFNVWNASFLQFPNSADPSPLSREQSAVNQTVTNFLSAPQVNSTTKQIFETVALGLNVTTWNQPDSISSLTIATMSQNIPSQLSTSLGVSATTLVTKLYDFGPSPSNSTLGENAISLFANTLPANLGGGLATTQLLDSSFNLGPQPTAAQERDLAASLVANITSSTFAGSPLFSVNSTSLAEVMSGLSQTSTAPQIRAAINGVVSNESFVNYPFLPSRAVTQNFISKDNQSSILILSFSSLPGATTINHVVSSVKGSVLENLGTVYVTGGPVITQDVQNVFTPALGVTLGPGVAISILIVGLLFLSPFAALIPIIMGGISIAIALPAIYFGIVVVGHGTITFLTPTLTTLLMLGLAVDYAVLQLRRTREERLNGKSLEESVAISVRWAGQAVLTAGITVVVAYIVMAVANVPLFSSVGTSIALGVSILLALSLTLLPSIELALGDRIFWPGMRRRAKPMRSRLIALTEATLRRKVVITVVVSAIAIGAFYTTYNTPVGEDFLKLIPNFPSNQGLTALTNSFGGGFVSPTQVVVVLQTPITYGDKQFNQTLIGDVEAFSNTAANSSGVVSVTSPTRPYGSGFDYGSLANMSTTLRGQYEGGMLSLIGNDNKTVLINVGLSSSSQTQRAIDSLLGMEKNIQATALSSGISVHYAGSTQQTYDSQSFLIGLLPQVVIILSAAVYVILFIQLRSAFTPIRLIFTILCSVVFSLAMLSLIFSDALGLPILDFAPLFVLVTMLGVGIDYDIFFVTRIREEVLGGKTDNEAITTAVDKVWVTILGLGLVLSTVFASLLITGIAMLQEISLAVSGAIVLDVAIILLFFVPSIMGLAEKFNWWPSKIGRVRQKPQASTS